jgi:hypothetical protein
MGERKNVKNLLEGESERKRPLGRPIYKWVGNIKVNLGDIGWGGMDWIDLALDMDM